ncbi:MAG: hypothetical protein EOP49_51400, partial [Sphingobacteriales bacterium]
MLILLALPIFGAAQASFEQQKATLYRNSKTNVSKMRHAFQLSEHLMEADKMEQAQKWLEIVKDLNQVRQRDTMACYIQSLQSEISRK